MADNTEGLSSGEKNLQSVYVPPLLKLLPCAVLCLGWVGMIQAKDESSEPALDQVWKYATTSQPIEARNILDELEGLDPRIEALANAVLDMSRAPLSETQWADIEPVFAELAQGDDEVATRALYMQARMHQIQQLKPDYARAEALYLELNQRWPGSHWAQLGLVKLGLVKLYALPEPVDVEERFVAVDALLAQITEPTLRRDLHLQMAWAGLFHKRHLDEVLPHLIAADKVGGMMGITPEDVMIQIGELSFRAGHLEQSKQYFERFLRDVPSNNKRFNVRMRLKEVDAALAEQERAK